MPDKVKIDSTNPDAVHQKVEVSAELAAVVGKGPMARGQVTSKLWDYVRSNKLQAKDDGREIEPDATLGAVIGTKRLTMFEMTAKVNKHITGPTKRK
jgi:chromatin remodeling complex protein RSC6